LTAFTDFETVVEAVNKGHIHGYINKPLQADEVRLAINNSLELYSLRVKNREMMAELEIANKELTSLDGLKSEIIKVISQEIRNPLNRIMGTLHLLKDKIEGEELSDVVNILDNSVSRLEEFSSMTEQISILKSPGHKLKISEIPVKRIIEYSIIEASERLKEQEIELDLQIEDENALVDGELHLLVSCLVNLVRNAIDHSQSGSEILIKTMRNEDKFYCSVVDQGKSYNEQLLEELSSQFMEGNRKLNLSLGIDLGLAQMIMEAHNGCIQFESTKDQRGRVNMIFNCAPS
jgi:signal transduction histidine kinase